MASVNQAFRVRKSLYVGQDTVDSNVLTAEGVVLASKYYGRLFDIVAAPQGDIRDNTITTAEVKGTNNLYITPKEDSPISVKVYDENDTGRRITNDTNSSEIELGLEYNTDHFELDTSTSGVSALAIKEDYITDLIDDNSPENNIDFNLNLTHNPTYGGVTGGTRIDSGQESITTRLRFPTGALTIPSSSITLGSASSHTVTVTGDLIVEENLTVKGTTTTVDSTTVAIGDTLIKLAKDNNSDMHDMGFYGRYSTTSSSPYSYRYTGLVRDTTHTSRILNNINVVAASTSPHPNRKPWILFDSSEDYYDFPEDDVSALDSPGLSGYGDLHVGRLNVGTDVYEEDYSLTVGNGGALFTDGDLLYVPSLSANNSYASWIRKKLILPSRTSDNNVILYILLAKETDTDVRLDGTFKFNRSRGGGTTHASSLGCHVILNTDTVAGSNNLNAGSVHSWTSGRRSPADDLLTASIDSIPNVFLKKKTINSVNWYVLKVQHGADAGFHYIEFEGIASKISFEVLDNNNVGTSGESNFDGVENLYSYQNSVINLRNEDTDFTTNNTGEYRGSTIKLEKDEDHLEITNREVGGNIVLETYSASTTKNNNQLFLKGSDGNVGVGTSNPLFPFHAASNTFLGNRVGIFMKPDERGTGFFRFNVQGNSYIENLYVGGQVRRPIATDPDDPDDYDANEPGGGTGSVAVENGASNSTRFDSLDRLTNQDLESHDLRVRGNAKIDNLGIGVSVENVGNNNSPTHRLDVSGSTRLSGSVGIGVDADGNHPLKIDVSDIDTDGNSTPTFLTVDGNDVVRKISFNPNTSSGFTDGIVPIIPRFSNSPDTITDDVVGATNADDLGDDTELFTFISPDDGDGNVAGDIQKNNDNYTFQIGLNSSCTVSTPAPINAIRFGKKNYLRNIEYSVGKVKDHFLTKKYGVSGYKQYENLDEDNTAFKYDYTIDGYEEDDIVDQPDIGNVPVYEDSSSLKRSFIADKYEFTSSTGSYIVYAPPATLKSDDSTAVIGITTEDLYTSYFNINGAIKEIDDDRVEAESTIIFKQPLQEIRSVKLLLQASIERGLERSDNGVYFSHSTVTLTKDAPVYEFVEMTVIHNDSFGLKRDGLRKDNSNERDDSIEVFNTQYNVMTTYVEKDSEGNITKIKKPFIEYKAEIEVDGDYDTGTEANPTAGNVKYYLVVKAINYGYNPRQIINNVGKGNFNATSYNKSLNPYSAHIIVNATQMNNNLKTYDFHSLTLGGNDETLVYE